MKLLLSKLEDIMVRDDFAETLDGMLYPLIHFPAEPSRPAIFQPRPKRSKRLVCEMEKQMFGSGFQPLLVLSFTLPPGNMPCHQLCRRQGTPYEADLWETEKKTLHTSLIESMYADSPAVLYVLKYLQNVRNRRALALPR